MVRLLFPSLSILNGLHALMIGKVSCPFLTLLQWARLINGWVCMTIDSSCYCSNPIKFIGFMPGYYFIMFSF